MAHAPSAPPSVNDEHPFALELSSLRAAVARYQHEAHATSLKLQRHSLEASQAIDHARALASENQRLKDEITLLRANPDTNPTEATFQVPELSLALRRLSDKLTSVEETLLARTEEVVDARSELSNVQNDLEAARALAEDARAREEEGLARERELARKLKAAEEERRMADLVVQEYADLVRKLEGRTRIPSDASTSSVDLQKPNNGSTSTLVDSLAEGKSGLQRLLEEFNGESERLEAEIAKLQSDNSELYKELEVTRLKAEHDRSELAKAQHELDKYRADDSTAAKMVSRYMKFSQTSTDTLQKAMDALRTRHSATLASLNAEIAHLQRALKHERSESDRLRSALDELTEDIAREAFGRRREVSLRLAFLGREENLAESLRRWIRRTRESLERSLSSSDDGQPDPEALRDAFARAVLEAEGLLETLNSQPSADDESPSGSVARLILAQDTVSSLTHELQEETVRRLKTERKLARLETPEHPEDVLAHQTKSLAQPTPHRVSIINPEIPLLERTSPPSAPTAGLPQAGADVGDAPSADITIDEIVIVPSLDASEEQASERLSESSSATSTTDSQPNAQAGPPTDTPSDVGGLVAITSDTLQASDTRTVEEQVPQPPPSVPGLVIEDPSDSLAVPFPSESRPAVTSPNPAPLLEPTPIPFPQSAPELLDAPLVPSSSASAAPRASSRAAAPTPLQLEATDGSSLSPLPSGPASPAQPAEASKEASLLADLAKIKHRYDSVQRGFRDCHLALKELKKSLDALPPPTTATFTDMHTLLRKAVERLGDFNEDARVELEIRIADEERIASGYEALLSIPGAIALSDDTGSADAGSMLQEIAAFVDGTDRAVEKATHAFAQKLDDLEHDIASIKRTLHELALAPPDESALSPSRSSTSTSPKWAGWAPSFLSPPRSTSPAPPTFGSVMTSPRLRHSSSFTRPRDSPVESPTDPLANLGLRIAVPSPVRSPTYGGLSPQRAGGPQRAGPRQRTTSGMFMLGLGMRSSSFGSSLSVHAGAGASASRTSLASASSSRLASTVSPKNDESGGEEEGDGIDSDVE